MSRIITAVVLFVSVMFSNALFAQPPCSSSNGLLTHYLAGNGLDGVMFDVVASSPITVNCFETHWSGSSGTLFNVEIWTRAGTHVGYEESEIEWTIVGSAQDVVSSGPGSPTHVPIPLDIAVAATDTQAFYIVCTDGVMNNRYTDGTTTGAVLASDANARILEGTGSNYPFGFNLAPREFNGTMYYTTIASAVTEVTTTNGFLVRPGVAPGSIAVTFSERTTGVIRVADLTGRTILEERIGDRADGTIVFEIPNATSGIYLVSLINTEGRFAERVFLP